MSRGGMKKGNEMRASGVALDDVQVPDVTQTSGSQTIEGGDVITLDTRVDLNILKIQSNKLLLFGGKFGINRYAH